MIRHHQLVGVIAVTLVVSVVAPRPAATTEPEVSPVGVVTPTWPEAFDAPMWCRPVVNAAVDPAPLTCWLTLATGELPLGLSGMNLGDLPAWADVDPDAVGAELTRYAEMLEAERLEAERIEAERRAAEKARQRAAASAEPPAQPRPSSGQSATGGDDWPAGEEADLPSDWVSSWQGGDLGIGPMPEECNGAAMRWNGAWMCLDR